MRIGIRPEKYWNSGHGLVVGLKAIGGLTLRLFLSGYSDGTVSKYHGDYEGTSV